MNRKTEKFEEDEEVSVALPPDTQAILQEFLRNQSLQKTLECQHNVFEEDWVSQIVTLCHLHSY